MAICFGPLQLALIDLSKIDSLQSYHDHSQISNAYKWYRCLPLTSYPIIERLRDSGAKTFNASINKTFKMCATLVWTSSDFPRLENLSR